MCTPRILIAIVVVGAAAPSQAQQPARWRLVEEWRVGGEVEGPPSASATPTGGSICGLRA